MIYRVRLEKPDHLYEVWGLCDCWRVLFRCTPQELDSLLEHERREKISAIRLERMSYSIPVSLPVKLREMKKRHKHRHERRSTRELQHCTGVFWEFSQACCHVVSDTEGEI